MAKYAFALIIAVMLYAAYETRSITVQGYGDISVWTPITRLAGL